MNEETRLCLRCKVERKVTDFKRYVTTCHFCVLDQEKGYRQKNYANPEYIARVIKRRTLDRKNNPEKYRKLNKRYASGRKYSDEQKYRNKVRKMVRKAVFDGEMMRPTKCQTCSGSGKIEAHHEDYDKPLDVMWLCVPCHARIHREKRGIFI